MWSGVFHENCWLCNNVLEGVSWSCVHQVKGHDRLRVDHPVSSFSFQTSSDPPPPSSFFHFLAPPHSDTGFHLLKQKLTVLLSTRSRASFFLQERWKNKHVYTDTFCRFQIHICKLHHSSAPPPSCWRAYTHIHTRSHGTGLFISQPANHMMDPTTSIKSDTWEGSSTGQSPTRT